MLRVSSLWYARGFGTTDAEVARYFGQAWGIGNKLRHCPALGWFNFHRTGVGPRPGQDNGAWRTVSDTAARAVIREEVTEIVRGVRFLCDTEHTHCDKDGCTTACKRAQTLLKALRRYESAKSLGDLLREISIRVEVLVDDADRFDAHPYLLNCPNGVVDLRTGALEWGSPDLLMTRMTGAPYLPEAVHADWTQALDAFSPLSEETQAWINRFLGSGASGHTLADSLNVFLHGNGANGKSTVLGAVDSALGDYSGTVPNAAIETGSSYEQRVAMLSFRGKRFTLLEETTDDMRLATVAIKKLSSGNTVDARVLGKGNVSFTASHTLAIATNHAPYVKESDKGTWRRLVLVPFKKDYTREPTFDNEIRERLIEGADGRSEAVLAWLVAGCRAWYASGRKLTPLPAELQNSTNEWREDTDLLGEFITACLNVTGDFVDKATKRSVWEDFEDWCGFTGNKNPYSSQRGFNTALKAHEFIARSGVTEHRGAGGVKCWSGIVPSATASHSGHPSVTTF